MAYKITFTSRFEKNYKKLSQSEKQQVGAKLKLLSENPMHPSLRTKRIKGSRYKDLFECSVNMDIRIVWYYEDDTLILLLNIGHHDILNHQY